MARQWCLGCGDWVEAIERELAIDRQGGERRERSVKPNVVVCPHDDGTTSGHVLLDKPPE
jgi:hypothetical protein